MYSQKTKSVRVATNRALIAAAQLDTYWFKLRMKNEGVPKQHLAVSEGPIEGSASRAYRCWISKMLGPTARNKHGERLLGDALVS